MTNPSEAVELPDRDRMTAEMAAFWALVSDHPKFKVSALDAGRFVSYAVALAADHPPQAEGEAFGSSPDGDAHRVPAKPVLDSPVMALLLDYLDGKPLVVPASEAPTMKDAATAIRALAALVEEHRAGEEQMYRWMDGMQDLLADYQQAAPASDTTAGYGADAIGVVDHPAPQQGVEAVREALVGLLPEVMRELDPGGYFEGPSAHFVVDGTLDLGEITDAIIAALRPSPDSKDGGGTDG